MDWKRHITFNPQQRGVRPCIRGMRIRVIDILDLLTVSLSHQDILKNKYIVLALLFASTYFSVCAQSNHKIGVNLSTRWTRPTHFDDQY